MAGRKSWLNSLQAYFLFCFRFTLSSLLQNLENSSGYYYLYFVIKICVRGHPDLN